MASNLIGGLSWLAMTGCAIFGGVVIFKGSEFFYSELMHAQLMALGDVREPTFLERLKTGLIWMPFILYAIAALLAIGIVGNRIRSRSRRN